MPHPILSDSDFIDAFTAIGPAALAQKLGVKERGVFARRRTLERKHGSPIASPRDSHNPSAAPAIPVTAPGRLEFEVKNGVVLVGSDSHFWPGIVTTAFRAFVQFAKEMKPAIVVMNGDMLDGATISKHPPIGWENRPSLIEEIETCQERLSEVVDAAPKAKRIWCLGNHDARFSTRLATMVPEYAKVHGTSLKDHFPLWQAAWSCWINDAVVVKHRVRAGIHAPHNNTMWAGKTIVTGHLHSAKVMPITDYNGTRWGVDAGCLADPYGPQFEYNEDSPRNHRSAFCVLFFDGGRLLQPQLCLVVDDKTVDFCGRLMRV